MRSGETRVVRGVSTTDELVGLPSFGDVVVETEGEGRGEVLEMGFGV